MILGLLNVPDSAGVTKPVTEVFIPLHPLAIKFFWVVGECHQSFAADTN